MTDLAAEPGVSPEPFKFPAFLACAIAAAYVGALALLFLRHQWIFDAQGHPNVTDFLEVWVAGRFALAGHAATAYDWHAHHTAQAALAGHDFHGVLNWSYPPTFLFVAALLACLPYGAAYAGWVAASIAAYAAAIGAIVKRWDIAIAACAMPVVFANALVGQNGALTAALMGAALLFLESRPLVSGIFLGLMTYKPQLGILFPLVLVLDGHWRALASATVTSVLLFVASWFAFGLESWRAFFHFLPATSQAILTGGGEDWHKMQSIYALVRMLGAEDKSAWIAQGILIALCVAILIGLWRVRASFAVRAAALAVTSMLVTPYLHMYDFAIMTVPLAFLFRERAFDRFEWTAVILANLLFVAFVAYHAPIGVAILAIVLGLILRRAVDASTPQHVALNYA